MSARGRARNEWSVAAVPERAVRGDGPRVRWSRLGERRRDGELRFVVGVVGGLGGGAGALEREADALALVVLVADVALVEGGRAGPMREDATALLGGGLIVFETDGPT